MIKSLLYRQPELLDPKAHRQKKMLPLTDYSVAKDMHAVFLAATEFPMAALSFAIIFVHTGERLPDGKPMITPVALLGITNHENLHVEGTRWDADYVPAFIRRFPLLTAGVQGSEAPAVFVDASWPGFNDAEGEPLFGADGAPSAALKRAIDFLQQFDQEQQRTRQFCARVIELDLLKEVTFEASLPNGETLKIEGVLTIDEDKLVGLPDAVVLDLHRNGMLMLMQIHLISLHNMKQLLERKARRLAAATAAA